MLHSALINVMVKAARRAGRSLKRDLGEVEHLQVSLKGPANFVTLADKRAEEMLYADLSKARPDAPEDRIEGLKWHIVAKTAGKGDLKLDEALTRASPEDRAKAEAAARKWLGAK